MVKGYIVIILFLILPIVVSAQVPDSLYSTDTLAAPNPNEILDRILTNDEIQAIGQQLQLYLDDLTAANITSRSSPLHLSINSSIITHPDALGDPNYSTGSFHGSPEKISNRISVTTKDFEFYFVQSKDEGEPIFFDRIGAALSLRRGQQLFDDFRLSKLTLGDYSLNEGAGLIFSRGYPSYPSQQSAHNIFSADDGIKAYRSISSYRFFRGAAGELQYDDLRLSVFFSDRLIDASVDSSGITSLPFSNYHRTETELAKRNAARQTMHGAVLSYANFDTSDNGFSIGMAGYRMKFDNPVAMDSNTFHFYGQHHSMLSLFATSVTGNLEASGEYGRTISDMGTASAVAVTAQYDLSPVIRLTANYHNLAPRFYSPFGSTFGLYSDDAQNELGYYLGASYAASPYLSFFGFGIFGRNSYPAPEDGLYQRTFDSRIGAKLLLGKQSFEPQMQFLRQWKTDALLVDSLLELKLQPQLLWTYDISSTFKSKVQLKYCWLSNDNSTQQGYMIGIGARYVPIAQLTIGVGMSFYRTDTFNIRFYSSEPDLPNDASYALLYGNGSRYLLTCRYSIFRFLSVAGSISETLYSYPIGAEMAKKTTLGVQCNAGF
ncbi:MAG TPA: hypothetical protein VFO76_12395 [Candidatus Kapabacteria bacterium]|nr:hypothetical protein [Candidatus Kapabacteria bacterium]